MILFDTEQPLQKYSPVTRHISIDIPRDMSE